jgi:16S rRNA (cytidine1402-2'-O)-methyltransferase
MAQGRIELIATPIGNLADLPPRAREVLANADIIAAEDTRHTAGLLRQLGIDKPLLSTHEHNEASRASELVRRAQDGAVVALVTDAGMPLVSDPGFLTVRAAIEAGVPVSAVPGPSAVLLALALSGLPAGRFCFEGFLPARAAARRAALRALAGEGRTMVFFEAPHRIAETLEDMKEAFGADREAAVARELTKLHESVYRGSLGSLLQIAAKDANFARGEITVVVAGAAAPAGPDEAFVRRALNLLSAELPPGRAAALVAQLTGRRRADVYALLPRGSGNANDNEEVEAP